MFDIAQFQRKADLRGVYPTQINEELAWLSGLYLVRKLREMGLPERVLVGRDGRLSSREIYSAHIAGIVAEGGVAIPCDYCTSDMIQWAVGEELEGGLCGSQVTASHNPAEYNGIKIVVKNRQTGGLDIMRPVDYCEAGYVKDGRQLPDASAAFEAPYADMMPLGLQERFVEATLARAPMLAEATHTIVLDPGNGVGGILVPLMKEALKKIGSKATVLAINEEIDGSFPTRPSNPGLPESIAMIEAEAKKLGGDFVASFDGDADRVFFTDENGKFVQSADTLAALAKGSIEKGIAAGEKEPAVVFSAVASWLVIDKIRQAGGRAVISRVGQDAVKVALEKTKAVFGGESSAHYNFPDCYGLDSGMFALAAFWQLLIETGRTCSTLLDDKDAWSASGEINLKMIAKDWKAQSKLVIDHFKTHYAAPEQDSYVFNLDGVAVYHPRNPAMATIDDVFQKDAAGDPEGGIYRTVNPDYQPKWWISVRASNNEPLLRLNVECAAGEDMEGRTRGIIADIQKLCATNGGEAPVQDWGNLQPA
jgi:phosphomannomutase